MTQSAPPPTRDIVTLGEAMTLFIAEPGSPLRDATHYRRSVAGAESNVAIGLARLGHRTGWIGRLGNDALGDAIHHALRGEGVDTTLVTRDQEAATGILIRDCHGTRPTEVVYQRRHSAGSHLAATHITPDYIADFAGLHITGITPLLSETAHAAVHAAVDAAKSARRTVSFDPNIRLRLAPPDKSVPILRTLSAKADIVLAGDDEAELITGHTDPHKAAGWFLDRGAHTVVLKRSARGAWATNGKNSWTQPALPAVPVDPIGAGDAFTVGYLSGWLQSHSIEASLHTACALGALAVQTIGDYEGTPMAEILHATATALPGQALR
ncbi:sugar kinase (plasmid) [Embleya sp. NBC_00888]|uniref:sugar kinase n=1 Tax=Embleya sp. NBC_00888 TaxID=2975960 RepID=UPI002F9111B3|nr:sugar kinase [Embleya sp. NBC_00888]